MNDMKETAHLLTGGAVLTGIVSHPPPEAGTQAIGVILFNAGVVHRVGPNRIYVSLARRLAALGFPSLRVDLSGVGDSPVRDDGLPIARGRELEAVEAMNHLQSSTGCGRFVLIGLCSGAETSLRGALVDDRAVGAVLINARRYGMDDAAFDGLYRQALRRHYWRMLVRSSFRFHSAARLVGGGIGWGNVGRALRSLSPRPARRPPAEHEPRAIMSLLNRGTRVYCIHSEADEGLDCLDLLLGPDRAVVHGHAGFTLEVLVGADHTFTLRWSQEELLSRITDWMRSSFAPS